MKGISWIITVSPLNLDISINNKLSLQKTPLFITGPAPNKLIHSQLSFLFQTIFNILLLKYHSVPKPKINSKNNGFCFFPNHGKVGLSPNSVWLLLHIGRY